MDVGVDTIDVGVETGRRLSGRWRWPEGLILFGLHSYLIGIEKTRSPDVFAPVVVQGLDPLAQLNA